MPALHLMLEGVLEVGLLLLADCGRCEAAAGLAHSRPQTVSVTKQVRLSDR